MPEGPFVMKPWIYLAGALAAIALLAGVYAFGRSDGRAIEVAKQVATEAAVKVEREKREGGVDQVGAGAAKLEQNRQSSVKEIYHESTTVTERPVYRNVCVDADGVRLLDRAAVVANGEDPGIVPGATGDGAAGPTRP